MLRDLGSDAAADQYVLNRIEHRYAGLRRVSVTQSNVEWCSQRTRNFNARIFRTRKVLPTICVQRSMVLKSVWDAPKLSSSRRSRGCSLRVIAWVGVKLATHGIVLLSGIYSPKWSYRRTNFSLYRLYSGSVSMKELRILNSEFFFLDYLGCKFSSGVGA